MAWPLKNTCYLVKTRGRGSIMSLQIWKVDHRGIFWGRKKPEKWPAVNPTMPATATSQWLVWHHGLEGAEPAPSNDVSVIANHSVSVPSWRKLKYLDFTSSLPWNSIICRNAGAHLTNYSLRRGLRVRQCSPALGWLVSLWYWILNRALNQVR